MRTTAAPREGEELRVTDKSAGRAEGESFSFLEDFNLRSRTAERERRARAARNRTRKSGNPSSIARSRANGGLLHESLLRYKYVSRGSCLPACLPPYRRRCCRRYCRHYRYCLRFASLSRLSNPSGLSKKGERPSLPSPP